MSAGALPPFAATSGPPDASLLIVGEAWGESEQQSRKPFAGSSGQELFRMLGEAMPALAPELHSEVCASMRYGLAWLRPREQWLRAAHIAMTNVFALRPLGNKLESICIPKADLPGDYPALGPLIRSPRMMFVAPQYLPELDRLRAEIAAIRPNVIVALGNTACWALLHATNIGSIRGNIAIGADGSKVLPTYHPSAVLRQWSWRPIVVADLAKAFRESGFAELRRPRRQVLINPSLVEAEAWTSVALTHAQELSVDIETGAGQIKCIGFATSPSDSLVIPFVDLAHPSGSYWPTPAQEGRAWALVHRLLASPIPKTFQNGIYDLQYLIRRGLRVNACAHDTMLLHHSMYPELQKGLGFLGSIYTNEASWKLMNRPKADTEKRDE